MDRQKIIFLIYSLGVGGAEKALVNIIKNLDLRKFSVRIVVIASDVTLQRELPAIIPITKLRVEGRFTTLRAIIPLARLIWRESPKVIISFMWGTNLIVLLSKLIMRFQSKIIISERTYLGKAFLNYSFPSVRKMLIKILYPRADKIIAVSSGVEHNLLDQFNLLPHKIKVIPNGVDVSNIRSLMEISFAMPFKDEGYIISIGRLEKVKNYPLLLKAYAKISKNYNIGLVILGEGSEREYLAVLIHNLGLEGKVLMPGTVDNPFPWISNAKVLVLCSIYEGFPNVILEAMACKVPVVATRCLSGPEEIIHNGETGILVENNNVEKLKEAIMTYLDKPSLAKEISAKAFEEIKNWDIKMVAKEYEAVIESI